MPEPPLLASSSAHTRISPPLNDLTVTAPKKSEPHRTLVVLPRGVEFPVSENSTVNLAVLPWGTWLDETNRARASIPKSAQIILIEDLFTPEEFLALDRELTRWCREWHNLGEDRGEWGSPESILHAARHHLRRFWGSIVQFLACLDRLLEVHPFEVLVVPQGASIYIDSELIEDLCADFAAAHGITLRIAPRDYQRWSTLESARTAIRKFAVSCVSKTIPRMLGEPRKNGLRIKIDDARIHPWFYDALRENPTAVPYESASRRSPTGLLRGARALAAMLGVMKRAKPEPQFRGVALKRTWPERWHRIAWRHIFPSLLKAFEERELDLAFPPDAIVTTDVVDTARLLQLRENIKRPRYYLHHGLLISAMDPFAAGMRHITGWAAVPDELAERGEFARVFSYPTSHMLVLRDAGDPPREFAEEIEAKMRGKRTLIVIAPSFATPYSVFIAPHDVERWLAELVPWFVSRPDTLFFFKLHPFSDKDHNEGRHSNTRQLEIINAIPESMRMIYDGDFNASVSRHLYHRADLLVDGYSSITHEALVHGLPVAVFDPSRQKFRFTKSFRAHLGKDVIFESDTREFARKADRLLESEESRRVARTRAKEIGQLLHRDDSDGWKLAIWNESGSHLPFHGRLSNDS